MSEWYYGKGGAHQGPVSDILLRSRISSGAIDEETLLWKKGMPEWQMVSTFPDLMEVLKNRSVEEAVIPPAMPDAPVSHIPPRRPPRTDGGSSVQRTQQSRSGSRSRRYSSRHAPICGLAQVSLLCCVVGFFLCGLLTMAGIVCGHRALIDIRNAGGMLRGRGLAVASLILGYIGLILQAYGSYVRLSSE